MPAKNAEKRIERIGRYTEDTEGTDLTAEGGGLGLLSGSWRAADRRASAGVRGLVNSSRTSRMATEKSSSPLAKRTWVLTRRLRQAIAKLRAQVVLLLSIRR